MPKEKQKNWVFLTNTNPKHKKFRLYDKGEKMVKELKCLIEKIRERKWICLWGLQNHTKLHRRRKKRKRKIRNEQKEQNLENRDGQGFEANTAIKHVWVAQAHRNGPIATVGRGQSRLRLIVVVIGARVIGLDRRPEASRPPRREVGAWVVVGNRIKVVFFFVIIIITIVVLFAVSFGSRLGGVGFAGGRAWGRRGVWWAETRPLAGRATGSSNADVVVFFVVVGEYREFRHWSRKVSFRSCGLSVPNYVGIKWIMLAISIFLLSF